MDKSTLEQMQSEHLLMRKLDKRMELKRHEIKDILEEMNERYARYLERWRNVDFCVFQTIQDYQQHYNVLQMFNKKHKTFMDKLNKSAVDFSSPVIQLKDGRKIYCTGDNLSMFVDKKPKE